MKSRGLCAFDTWRVVIALVAALCAVSCSDVDEGGTSVPSFADLDTNDDGFLSRQETRRVAALVDVFSVTDVDQDGRLSVDEFSDAAIGGGRVSREATGRPQFDALDRDGNHVISLQEAASVPELVDGFASFDDDGSGSLDFGEYKAAVRTGLGQE